MVSPDAVLGHQDTRDHGRAAPWVIALDSRAEILLRYSLPFCDRVFQLSGKRNPTVRDFMHYTGRGRLENPWGRQPEGYRRPFGRVAPRADLR